MLVLTRKPGEQIVVGDNIRITVVSIGPGRVKIGIVAPPHISVNRQEIYEKIQLEHAEQSDVLASLTRSLPCDDVSPTIVAGGDTSLSLHNRIAETVPEVPMPSSPRPVRKSR